MIKQTLYFGNPSYLHLKRKQLVIQQLSEQEVDEKPPAITRPIEDVAVILLDNPRITITHNLVKALLDNKAAIISCNEAHMPSGLMLTMEGHSEQSERYRYQVDASQPLKKNLWQQTVEQKVFNQMTVLQILGKKFNRLNVLRRKVTSGDLTNIEGQAASYYWTELFGNEFLRDRYGEAPNGLLNYGYSIIRSMVARALVSSGLNLTMGIHHRNKYNPFCLADDIMEPFRPFVDLVVFYLFEEFGQEVEVGNKEVKSRILSIGTVDAFFGKIKRPLMVGMATTTSSLVECYMGKRRLIKYPRLLK